jgi:DNA-binding transcriptional ArsR family regulator
VTTVFEVLAESRRRRILDLVRDRERSVSELVAALAMSQPAVSKHLRVLREAGLVEVRAAEQRRLYRLRPGPLRELDAWLAPYRQAWDTSLDRLEQHLDEMAHDEMAHDEVSRDEVAHDEVSRDEVAHDEVSRDDGRTH